MLCKKISAMGSHQAGPVAGNLIEGAAFHGGSFSLFRGEYIHNHFF
jgi:hypothetical protein